MVRGIEGRRIFLGDDDRRDFVDRLDLLLPEMQWRCFAWALMPNHAHLVMQGARGGLSRLMARLNTGYARGFKLRHARTGYLFQNRFRSRLVENDRDLMALVLYVHRNRLAGGLVGSIDALERDRWCGHGALVGIRPPRSFESVGTTLALFADQPDEARRRLRTWMRAPDVSGADSSRDQDLGECAGAAPRATQGSDPRVGRGAESDGRDIEVPEAREPGELVRALLAGVSLWLGVPAADICCASPRRLPARARAAVAHLAVQELGLPGRSVAATLGISASVVSHALRRGRAVVQEERLRVVDAVDPPGS
jgi:REP element-mobilizing transposase RayT